MQRTFAFLDLAGFTALTEAHGDEEAADHAGRLVAVARASLGPGDELVKAIGDAVMLTAPEPDGGVALVRRIAASLAAVERFPLLRGGLHHGEAVAREADWFGGAVNLAARVAAEAAPGQLLFTDVVAAALPAEARPLELGEFCFRHLVEPVRLFALPLLDEPGDLVVDPVCRMRVERRTAAGRLRHGCIEYLFCSLECAGAFAADPDRYTPA